MSAELNQVDIAHIVDRVVARLRNEEMHRSAYAPGMPERLTTLGTTSPTTTPQAAHGERGTFPTVNAAVAAARQAFRELGSTSLNQREAMIGAMRALCRNNVQQIARDAVTETGLGRVDDKIAKNTLVIDLTPGPEILAPTAFSGDNGLTLVERAPFGVIGAITPSTNPTETIICNSIGMLAGGNAVVFNVHPAAKRVSSFVIDFLNQAIESTGGPPNLLTCVADPTIESAQELMQHPDIRLLVVTGGPGVVRAAMNSGKRAIAAGPGNPPAVVDETADIPKAARDIVAGASFDNNIVCIVEKEILAVNAIADQLKAELLKNNAYEVSGRQLKALEKVVLTPDGHSNKDFIGKNACVILEAIGVTADESLRLVIAETPPEHPFVQEELLMPVVPFVRLPDVTAAIDFAVEVEHGFGHTATMHSTNIENLHRMAAVINTSIFVKNAPSYAGLGKGGEGYTSFTIASPTGEGLTTAVHFTRERRCTLAEYFRIV